VDFSPIVELRQYTLLPGMRDVLIDLFEANLVESQETTGMKIIGTFRDLGDETKFVWLRGFESMDSRARSLGDFYGGPVWKSNRDAANGTMVDSDDVLLLRPAQAGSAFTLDDERPPLDGDVGLDRGIVEATILSLSAPADKDTMSYFDDAAAPLVVGSGATVLACLVTEERPNNFPALPIRDENVLVWLAGYSDRAAFDAALEARDEIGRVATGAPRLTGAPVTLQLAPTRRSLLTGAPIA
jgi:hypothetical protein